jgi:SAM-dependent methyltransferase
MRTLDHGGAARPDHTLRLDERNVRTHGGDAMSQIASGQVSTSAAEIYEEFYLPALFLEWAPRMAAAAGVGPNQRVLDVACGTGVLARALAERVKPRGAVTGLDINEGMLAVARRKAPAIDWRHGAAEALPFADGSFDVVVSQFALMFFQDRAKAIGEMLRALRPGGKLAVAVWDSLDRTPAYRAFVGLLDRLFGAGTAEALRSPFVLGDTRGLAALFRDGGAPDVEIITHEGTGRFPSVESWVFTDVKGWTAADLIDDDGYRRLLVEAERELRPFVAPDGAVAFAMPAHIVTATKPYR